MQWHGPYSEIKIGNFWLANPLTYVRTGGRAEEPSVIDDSLPVKQHPFADQLGYWPSYACMSPAQRHEYLTWMSTGRQGLPPELGYIFVFFYGLERRALVDGADHRVIFDEVLRLRKLHESGAAKISRSLMSYSGTLLWLLLARGPGYHAPDQVRDLVLSPERWGAERSRAALAWAAHHFEHLPAMLAFTMASVYSGLGNGRRLTRIQKELRQLFAIRYAETHGVGIPLRAVASGKMIQLPVEHFTASAALGSYRYNVSLPQATLQQVEKLGALWDECIRELWPLAALTDRRDDASHPLLEAERWEALPQTLRQGPHPYQKTIVSRVKGLVERQQFAPVAVRAIAGDCHIQDISSRDKWTKGQCLALGRTLDHCGFAVEPDYRITGKAYAQSDTVVIFEHESEAVDNRKYRAACLMLRLGLLAAAADGLVEKTELDIIAKHILESFGLNRAEQKRMRALAGLLRGTKIDALSAKATLDLLSAAQRKSTAKLLIAVAAADGVITRGEMKHLKTCFIRLGLGESMLDSLLRQLDVDQCVQIAATQPAKRTNEAIPAPPTKAAKETLQLDKVAIASLLKETQEVQSMLVQAIAAQDEQQAEEVLASESLPVDTVPLTDAGTTVPTRYAAFYQQLTQRTVWPRVEAKILASEHGHMLSGALEALNDWAMEQGGSPIFYEEGEEIVVELETVAWA